MITLLTGLPGNGKTLYIVSKVGELHPNRPIYYYNIKDLKLDWQLIENPAEWYNLPHGAVIIIDECQDVFPTRSGKEPVPEKCKRFEIHRKQGHDIYLITQKSRQIDVHVRELVNQHLHIDRLLGAQKSQIFEWKYVVDDVNDQRNRDKAVKTFFNYPKESYKLYHSAEVHTVKRRIPWVIWAIPIAIAFVWFAISSAISILNKKSDSNKVIDQLQQQVIPQPKLEPIQAYYVAHKPLIEGLPYTAPIYQEATKATIPPIPAACIKSASKGCLCWSQQGTRLSTPLAICESIVKTGLFLDFNPHPNQQNQPLRVTQSQSSTIENDSISIPASTGASYNGSPINNGAN